MSLGPARRISVDASSAGLVENKKPAFLKKGAAAAKLNPPTAAKNGALCLVFGADSCRVCLAGAGAVGGRDFKLKPFVGKSLARQSFGSSTKARREGALDSARRASGI